MDLTTAGIFLGGIVALGITLWGLFSARRSPIIAVIGALVAVLATVGAWYAWSETKSTPWTVGYAMIVLAAIASSLRQFIGGRGDAAQVSDS